jgi:hypothetical protein
MNALMVFSRRERVMSKTCFPHAARTRSGDVSPAPPPFLNFQNAMGPGGVLPSKARLRHDARGAEPAPLAQRPKSRQLTAF